MEPAAPPISSGTILQNRYHLISVLGQGGFGRTYLAEDQGRFNEPCALKELIPPPEPEALEKSKELFEREAATLYQIKHPQVPQFRATFEENGRLFLVQDYVEGKTYLELLKERKAQAANATGQAPNPGLGFPTPTQGAPTMSGVFSEQDVWQLIRQLLPVLDHIHRRGIIHRDITPDNIILRNTDNLPVLIDFGVVKELATRINSPGVATPATAVGKFGYAPSEQLQTGRAYPSSDLYSLAVSAVVLLTGKEPRELFDDRQLTWNWRRWTNVSDEFAKVLDRMLSYRPGDRYQTAIDVVQALPNLATATTPVATAYQQPDPNVSQAATLAVGRPPEPTRSIPRVPEPDAPVIPEPRESSIWDNPWAVVGIGTGLALLAGLGSWAIVGSLLRGQNPPVTASPTVTLTPTPTPTVSLTPTPTPTQSEPTTFSQRLNLAGGQAISQAGTLRANSTVNYIIPGQQDQTLNAALTGEGALMTILGPDQRPVNNRAGRVTQWEGELPFTGDYTVQLSPVQGLERSDYRLSLSLANSLPPSPSPSPSPIPTTTASPVSPSFDTERVTFPPGQLTGQLSARTSPQQIKRYLVTIPQGEQLTVDVQQGDVALDIRDPDGNLIPEASGVQYWQFQPPRGGEYQVDVRSQRPANFTLTITFGEGG